MVDVEKELGTLFNKLKVQEKQLEEDYQKNQDRLQAVYDEFDKLVTTMILPVMRDYQIYLQKKVILSDITREPKPGRELIGPYSIKFELNDLNNVSRSATFPNLKFTLAEENIVVTKEIKGKTDPPDTYTKDQINQELVASKLTSLIKTCYDV